MHGEIDAVPVGHRHDRRRDSALPVVPVRLVGVDRVLHQTWRMARPGPRGRRFGPPLVLEGDDYAALARRVQEEVAKL